MIVGIVLLIIFLFLYYISTLYQPESDLVTTTQTLVKGSLLKSYVTKCLQRVAVDGLALVGNQGGKIYFGEGDPTVDYFGKKVLVGISYLELPSWAKIPYPFKQERLPVSYFGKDNVPALCDSEGPNAITRKYQPCVSYSFRTSIQKQLQVYIDQNLKKCTQLDTLFQGVDSQKPNSEVIIGSGNLWFNLVYPLNYTVNNQIFELLDFNYIPDVRLKKFHEFIKAIIQKETSTPDFSLNQDYKKLDEWHEGFHIKIINNVVSNFDLIEVTDFRSIIDGHAYSFKFFRENRKPIIMDANVLVTSNRVEITPIVADPDEDILKMFIDNTAFQELDGTFYMQPILLGSGSHTVIITIRDEFGLKSSQELQFEI